MNAGQAFFNRLIDHAALFPPAALDMGAAVRADREIRAGRWREIAGPFICPASRLDEFGANSGGGKPVPLAVICDVPLASVAGLERHTIVAVETVAPLAGGEIDQAALRAAVQAMSAAVDEGTRIYFEIPWAAADLERALAQVAFERARVGVGRFDIAAKMRCGAAPGTPPPVERVAEFIHAAAAQKVPLKATAGLHHAVRNMHGSGAHGFLNVAGATLLARARSLSRRDIAACVADDDPAAFVIDGGMFAWREHRIDTTEIADGRAGAFRSFGSCSILEPLDDLRELGLFAPAAA